MFGYKNISLSGHYPILSYMSVMEIIPTLFESRLSDITDSSKNVSKEQALSIMQFFAAQTWFNWTKSHNGCEARADAVSVLLEQWGVPHYKGWVFGGRFLHDHVGALKQNWKYHVAVMLQVEEDGQARKYIIDPATSPGLQSFYDWASGITDLAHSYHLVKEPHWYIFPGKKITANNWHARNRQNRKWMIQGLAGINGLDAKGKAALVFNKESIRRTKLAFEQLKSKSPAETICKS